MPRTTDLSNKPGAGLSHSDVTYISLLIELVLQVVPVARLSLDHFKMARGIL